MKWITRQGEPMHWNDYDEPLVDDLGFIPCTCVLSFLCGMNNMGDFIK
jgi:hypothetical protein